MFIKIPYHTKIFGALMTDQVHIPSCMEPTTLQEEQGVHGRVQQQGVPQCQEVLIQCGGTWRTCPAGMTRSLRVAASQCFCIPEYERRRLCQTRPQPRQGSCRMTIAQCAGRTRGVENQQERSYREKKGNFSEGTHQPSMTCAINKHVMVSRIRRQRAIPNNVIGIAGMVQCI